MRAPGRSPAGLASPHPDPAFARTEREPGLGRVIRRFRRSHARSCCPCQTVGLRSEHSRWLSESPNASALSGPSNTSSSSVGCVAAKCTHVSFHTLQRASPLLLMHGLRQCQLVPERSSRRICPTSPDRNSSRKEFLVTLECDATAVNRSKRGAAFPKAPRLPTVSSDLELFTEAGHHDPARGADGREAASTGCNTGGRVIVI